jgi:hypothetical protein
LVQTYQNWKWPQSVPNGHTLHTYTKRPYIIPKWSYIVPNGRKVYQHFPFKALQNIPKFGFLVFNDSLSAVTKISFNMPTS